jgi:uncharacterized protein (TIGR02266 family)
LAQSTPDLVNRFAELDRRRLLGSLALDELIRWQELRDQLELGAERRATIRARTRLQVQVSWDAVQELARAHDLSEGGVFLQTGHPSEPGTPVELEMRDLRGRPLILEGTVAWVRLEAERVGPPGMGIKFRNVDDWDRAVLVELVEAALGAL